MGYISKKVAAYGQFVLVSIMTKKYLIIIPPIQVFWQVKTFSLKKMRINYVVSQTKSAMKLSYESGKKVYIFGVSDQLLFTGYIRNADSYPDRKTY